MAIGLTEFNKSLVKVEPQKVILVGDRFETYIAAIASKINNFQIIHFHGGETTTGAYDNYWRHSISIMSDIHFVANSVYSKRVSQLKNSSKRIYNVGGLGIDNIKTIKFDDKKKLSQKHNFTFNKNNMLIVYHSETVSPAQNKNNFLEIINACKKINETNFFISYPGHDLGSDEIINEIDKLSKLKKKNFFVFKNLGENSFLSLLKICDCIIGNSSSGIIEAPYLLTPTINLGIRQNGRLKYDSIFDCKINSLKIEKKLKLIKSIKDKKIMFKSRKLYGSGNAAEKAFKIISNG
jgi:GDP/UDP-N,N'-diacetylbacillosamine 2-epimerase (hydrolysing)